ncbi:MAG: hypothetical protein WBV93_06115 [Anaerobacillus sp.]
MKPISFLRKTNKLVDCPKRIRNENHKETLASMPEFLYDFQVLRLMGWSSRLLVDNFLFT